MLGYGFVFDPSQVYKKTNNLKMDHPGDNNLKIKNNI